MSANRGTTAALSELEEKLLHLKNLTEANQFMLEVLKDQGERLQEIDGDTARSMLREQARNRFSPTKGKTPAGQARADFCTSSSPLTNSCAIGKVEGCRRAMNCSISANCNYSSD